MEARPENPAVPPSARGLPADVLATHQRRRILAATIELVAKRGYRGTSIDQIVKAARVGYAAFYELFADKEECFCAAFDVIVDQARERIAAAIPSRSPWTEQVCAALRSLLELIAAEPFRARMVLTEVHTAGETAFLRHEALLDEVALQLSAGRTQCSRAERLPPTLEEATVGGIAWLLNQRVVMGELDSVEDLFSELALIVLEPYLGKAQALALIATQSDLPAPA